METERTGSSQSHSQSDFKHTHTHKNARTTGPPKVCHQINMPTHLTDAVFRVITESHLTSETCTHSDKLSFLCTSPEC